MTRKWTEAQVQQLVASYPHECTDAIAKRMGMTRSRVYNKAHALGLKKTPAFMASQNSGRIQRGRTNPSMVATQFKPGITPWNKGVNWVAGGRSAETRFKPGSKPHTWVPVGSYRVVSDKSGKKHLELKVADTPGPNTMRWRPVARIVWEKANGPIPDGSVVVFKPGMATVVLEDITDDRLECITRAELARRNHPRSRSPELAKLIQLKGAIARQLNRIAREAETK